MNPSHGETNPLNVRGATEQDRMVQHDGTSMGTVRLDQVAYLPKAGQRSTRMESPKALINRQSLRTQRGDQHFARKPKRGLLILKSELVIPWTTLLGEQCEWSQTGHAAHDFPEMQNLGVSMRIAQIELLDLW
jgi:hypothetical protein